MATKSDEIYLRQSIQTRSRWFTQTLPPLSIGVNILSEALTKEDISAKPLVEVVKRGRFAKSQTYNRERLATPSPHVRPPSPTVSCLSPVQSPLSDLPSSVLCQSEFSDLVETFYCPEFDLGLDMLASQDIVKEASPPKVPQGEPIPSTTNCVKMNCEGFQDLQGWIQTPSGGALQTPRITDGQNEFNKFEYYTAEDKSPEVTEACWRDWDLNVKMGTHPSHYSPPQSDSEHNYSRLLESSKPTNSPEKVDDILYDDFITIEDDSLPPHEVTMDFTQIQAESKMLDRDSQLSDLTNWIVSVESTVPKCQLKNDVFLNAYDYKPEGLPLPLSSESTLKCNQYSTQYNKLDTVQDVLTRGPNPISKSSSNAIFPLPLSNVKENNEMVINNIILADSADSVDAHCSRFNHTPSRQKLMLDLSVYNTPAPNSQALDVTTPDVLRTVEQLEADARYGFLPVTDDINDVSSTCYTNSISVVGYQNEGYDRAVILTPPDTPRMQSRKRRRDSESSDVSYVPPIERTSKRIRKNSNKTKPVTVSYVKRGRPPSRRDSVSSCSTNVDDSSSVYSIEDKYRERRDKNNEASRRSRYNRKLKDQEMTDAATQLEEKNAILRLKAEKLERQIKKFKTTMLNIILKK